MNPLEKICKIFKNTIFAITFILNVGFNCKTSKMKLLEKKLKIFIKALTIFAVTYLRCRGLNTPQKSICSGNTQKSNLQQFFLQSYRQ